MSLSDYGFSAGPISSVYILSVLLIAVAAFIAVVLYFSRALAYFELSKRSGLKNSWQGFVPVFRDLSCGKLAAGKEKSAVGKLMAALTAVNICLTVAFIALFGAAVIKVVFAADIALADGLEKLPESAYAPLNAAFIPAIILIFSSFINKILRIISVFRIYLRFAPKNAVIFLIAGIILPFLEPVFLFMIRANEPLEKNCNNNGAGFDFGV